MSFPKVLTIQAMKDLVSRGDFPLLANYPDLVFLDSAASTQKPRAVIESLKNVYETHYANIHRGTYDLSVKASDAFEAAREKIAKFIGAPSDEIIFTRNATESLNLVAYSWGMSNLKTGDEILLTEMEHHANLVPWHFVAEKTGAIIKVIPIDEDGRLEMNHLSTLISENTKVVSVAHGSNVLGTINPVFEIAKAAHAVGALMVLDGSQTAPHLPVSISETGADFFAFSGHKMCGPSGVGVLWGKKEILNAMPPFLGGGDMIDEVYNDHSTYASSPSRFEAGTPAIAEVIGLGVAAEYLQNIGMEKIWKHELELTQYCLQRIDEELPEYKTWGPRGQDRGGIVTFSLGDIHAHDLAGMLEQSNICVRAGQHCAQPLHRKLGLHSSTRASFYLYTTKSDIDHFVEALTKTRDFFKEWL